MIDECIVNGIISLPKNTFFSTEKKTYIIALTKKKQFEKIRQTSPIFTYLCSSTGETLDVNRFDTQENDLADAAYEYHSFKGNKELYKERVENGKINNPRLKILNIEWFINNIGKDWIIDNNWSDEEKIALGIKEEIKTLSPKDFAIYINDVISDLQKYQEVLNNV